MSCCSSSNGRLSGHHYLGRACPAFWRVPLTTQTRDGPGTHTCGRTRSLRTWPPARRPCRESGCGNHGLAQMAGPDGTATLIDQLRAGGTALIYDPVGRTLRADGHDAPSVTIGRDH